MSKRLKSQCLAASQDVVCKIRQLPFLVPLALLLAILFYLLRVALAILLPVVRVCLAPLPRTFEANLPVNRIAGDLLPMIIMTAFALACGLAANGLSRMISRRLKDLLTITAPEIFHRAAPSAMEIFSRKTPLDRVALSAYRWGLRTQKDHTFMRNWVFYKIIGSLRLVWRSVVTESLGSA